MTTPRILILYAHPAHERSHANRVMIEAARASAHAQVHDLYESYPDFHINIAYEQAQLRQADLIVFHHPIYWYSMPALQKEWLDLVLEYGWAFGPGGTALHGKDFWLVATTGGDEAAYQTDGNHGHCFDAFLVPYRQTAQLCGMRWHTPLILHGAQIATRAALTMHAANYRAQLDSYPDWPADLPT